MATPTKLRTATVAIAALILASIAAYMVFSYLSAKNREVMQAKTQVQQIVVAASDIPFGAIIQAPMLKTASWPVSSIPKGGFMDAGQIEGRFAVADIPVGTPVLASSLAPVKSDTGVMSFIIPPGDRAITVAVNNVVGVAGFILPNAVVDVIATVNSPYRPASSGIDARISKIILQNIKVLAVGQILEQKEGKPVTVPTVTLDVKPAQAEKLALASEDKIQLVLKHVGDTQKVDTKGATVYSLLGGLPVRPAGPARRIRPRKKEHRARPSIDSIKVIRGSAISNQTFK